MNTKSYLSHDVNFGGENYIEKHLATRAEPEGFRHADIRNTSLQMVGEGFPDHEIFAAMKQRYPEKDDKEIWKLIRGAHKFNPQPAKAGNLLAFASQQPVITAPVIKPFKLKAESAKSAIPKCDEPLTKVLLTAFNPDEIVSFTNKSVERNGKLSPCTNGTYFVVSDLVALLEKNGTEMVDGAAGAWLRLNPFKLGDVTGTDESVSSFRHLLVEFDKIPKEQQYQVLKQSGLPLTCIIDSGSKSLHGWVRVDAENIEQYKERAEFIYKYLAAYKLDPNNKNAARYSRMPNIKRDDVVQQLVELNDIEPEAYVEWYDKLIARPMVGGSILDYANAEIDDSATLLGDRYLCRGGGMFIVAPSGQGKSSLAVQLMSEWAIGGNPLGIVANGDLRVMLIQAEDDMGDITEMSRWILNAGFTHEKLAKIIRNTHVEPVNDVVGDRFIAALDSYCKQWKPDIVIINPYTSYLGDDAKDEKAANKFLREGLSPLLARHNCAAIIMHHTPKTQFNPSTDFTTTDFMYRGSGCATMTNWARAYLSFEPLPKDDKVFRFIAAKRGERIGWNSKIRFYRHSRTPGVIKWEQAGEEEVDAALKSNTNPSVKPVISDAELLSVFSKEQPISKTLALEAMEKKGASVRAAKSAFERFETDQKIVEAPVTEEKPKGRGHPSTKFVLKTAKSSPPESFL
jgi:RecA-family ATPase